VNSPPDPITFRIVSYERGGTEKTAATVTCIALILVSWAIFGGLSYFTPDQALKVACLAGSLAVTLAALWIALNGVRREELFFDEWQLIVETTRRTKVKESIFELASGAQAQVELVASLRVASPNGQGTAVVLATADGGSCWVATQATRRDQEALADEINRYFAAITLREASPG